MWRLFSLFFVVDDEAVLFWRASFFGKESFVVMTSQLILSLSTCRGLLMCVHVFVVLEWQVIWFCLCLSGSVFFSCVPMCV